MNSQGVLAQHQALLDAGRFMIQRCITCSKHVYFPRQICPHCGSLKVEFVAPSGEGTVYSVTTVRRKPEAGGDYNVCLVDLPEGVRLMSRVLDAEPAVGMAVHASVAVKEGKGTVVFTARLTA